MIVLKYLISRICSLDTNVELLQDNKQIQHELSRIVEESKNILIKKEYLLNSLHNQNLNINDAKKNNAIQNIRRSIFNNRVVKNKDLKLVDHDSILLIEDYQASILFYENTLNSFDFIYQNEKFKKINLLEELAKNENILNGLLLSSNSLIEAIYNRSSAQKKQIHFETGLLKYITRCIFKPTPFSSFTKLNIAERCKSHHHSILCRISPQKSYNSFIRVNNAIFQRLIIYMRQIKDIYFHLNINFNPSLEKYGNNKYKFLINKNNLEYFQEVDNNAVIELIYENFKNNVNFKFSDIITFLKNYIDADEEKLINYIYEFISIGLLEFDFKVSGTDDQWIDKLSDTLSYIPKSKSKTVIISLLLELTFQREEYETNINLITQRRTILNDVANILNNSLLELQNIIVEQNNLATNEFIEFKREKIFLEDTISNHNITLKEEFLEVLVNKIDLLIDYLSDFSHFKQNQIELYNFFNTNYDVEQIPLLTFYEDYYRFLKHKKENPSENRDINNFSNKKSFFSEDYFKIEKKSNTEVKFSLISDNIEKRNKHSYSSSMFFQIVDNYSANPKIVVNNLGLGYGRMSSRFLYMFSNSFTDEVKRLNNKLSESDLKIYSEVNDSSYFNANLHPPLFSNECIIPGGHKNVDKDSQLNVNKLSVRLNQIDKRLSLIDNETQKEVLVHDSCFQAETGRSQLFNLLLNFSDKVVPTYGILLGEINRSNKIEVKKGIYFYPRIIFEENVILQRKHWLIKESLPIISSTENESHFFARVNIWRTNLQIPSRIFVTCRSKKNDENVRKTDDYKPQYIDFENPIFTSLISRLFKEERDIQIMEALPSIDDALDYGDSKNVSEFLLQWYIGKQF